MDFLDIIYITIQGNNQLFQLTGDPNYVFDLQYHTSAEY